jgi:hypothetical protein
LLLCVAACGSSESPPAEEEGAGGASGGTPGSGGTGGGKADGGTGGKGNTGGGNPGSGGGNPGSGGGNPGSGGSTGTGGGAIPGTGLPPPGCGSGNVAGGPRWVGRVDATDVNAVEMAWQGAGLIANVTGTDIAVKLRAGDTIFYQPVVDGVPKARFSVTSGSDQTVTLATGLSAGDHVIELYRDTEGSKASSTFLGFTSGTVTGSCATNDRLIEIVGDSISAGFGDLGSETHPNWACNPCCDWTAQNSTWFQTYGALAGHQLNAEVSTMAVSGWGLGQDRGCGTGSLVPSVYENTLGTGGGGTWGFNPKAAAVVINLGTNDMACGSFSTATYTAAGIAFVQKIRSHYPNAWIFFTIGSMSGSGDLAKIKPAQDAIVTGAGDPKVSTFQFQPQNLGSNGEVPSGCLWHPSIATHAQMAEQLKTQLKAKLGW